MTNFSTDADLLTWEPEVFRLASIPGQLLAAGSTGTTASGAATLTDAGAGFLAAGVAAGHVVHLSKTGVYDLYLAVASVASATQLVLDAPGGIFSVQTGVAWEIHTFDPQHEAVHAVFCDYFDLNVEGEGGFSEDDIEERGALTRASAFDVLQAVFQGQSKDGEDLYARKSLFYTELYRAALTAVKLRFDRDGDGRPDATRTGHSVRLAVEEAGDAWPA